MAEFLKKDPIKVNRIEDNIINLETIPESKVTFDEEGINSQKNCVPGPNVKFNKNSVPFIEYMTNLDKAGTLGCNSDQYPIYTNGKYCCETEKSTPQELLDYINMLLENSIKNVGTTVFKNYSKEIDSLIKMRKYLLKEYSKEIKDNWSKEFSKNLDDYYSKNYIESVQYRKDSTHKEKFQGKNDIETNINSSINEIRFRPTSIPSNIKKSEYYNSKNLQTENNDKKTGGKRKYSRNCKKPMKRRKTVKKPERKSRRTYKK
jgi:hypothetical protein